MQLVKQTGLLLGEAVCCSDFNAIFNILHLFYCPHKPLKTNLGTEFKSCLSETESNFQKIYLVAFQVVFFVVQRQHLFIQIYSHSSLDKGSNGYLHFAAVELI